MSPPFLTTRTFPSVPAHDLGGDASQPKGINHTRARGKATAEHGTVVKRPAWRPACQAGRQMRALDDPHDTAPRRGRAITRRTIPGPRGKLPVCATSNAISALSRNCTSSEHNNRLWFGLRANLITGGGERFRSDHASTPWRNAAIWTTAASGRLLRNLMASKLQSGPIGNGHQNNAITAAA